MNADDDVTWGLEPIADSLGAARHWTRFRAAFGRVSSSPQPAAAAATQFDSRALARAFWAWAAVLEHDAAFEALDPVDYVHFAAGQLLARLLAHRPLLSPPASAAAEARLLTGAVLEQLQNWRRVHGAAPLDGLPLDADDPRWASFLENTAEEPELAIAFLDEFSGREPEWRYPQLVAERPAMRRARRAERGAEDLPAG